MSELLDELARSLARPMPRRHALRALGGAALGVWFGRSAQPGAAGITEHWCHGEVRKNGWKYCQPESQACFPACCPRERICSKGPCGSNGCCQWSCCDPCHPGGLTRPDGKGGCMRGPRSPDCDPKTCGPDITSALQAVVARTKAAFSGWSSAERAVACFSLAETPIGAFGWEINQLGPGGREQGAKNFQPDCATCGGSLSIQVGSGCHYAGSVNYVIYGVMMRLCHDHMTFDRPFFTEQSMTEYITLWKTLRSAPNLTPSLGWAKAGYNGWPNARTPRAELPKCAKCPKALTTPLTVRWLPIARNI